MMYRHCSVWQSPEVCLHVHVHVHVYTYMYHITALIIEFYLSIYIRCVCTVETELVELERQEGQPIGIQIRTSR